MNAFDTKATDPTLIADVLSGQQDRFQELILRHEKMVYAVAWSQLGNVDLAEEAAQQTFFKAYTGLESLRDTDKFRSWLAAIARNVSVSLGRTRRRELSNSVRWDIEPVAKRKGVTDERNNLTDELRATLAELPDTQRQVLTLFYLEGQSVKRVAETLDLTESAVKTRLSRARNLLREELERRLGDSLSELAPSYSLVTPIMATLPAATSLGVAAKLSLVGKIAAGFSFLITTIGGLFATVIPAWLFNLWFSKQVARDFREVESNDFRRKFTFGRHLNFPFWLLAASVATVVLFAGFGAETTFFLIAVFCLWGIWKSVRHLRVHDSKLSRAGIACLGLWFVTAIAVGICSMADVFNDSPWGMTPVVVVMFLHFAILFRYRNRTPLRNDYNLFLRAATGGLMVDEKSIDQQADHETLKNSINLSTLQLESFARFLGQHWLISDYAILADSIRLELPAVRPEFSDALFRPKTSVSSITIDSHCKCELYLSPSDKSAIDGLASTQVDRTGTTLTQAITNSVLEFSQGNQDGALRTLCAVEDTEIFKPEARESLSRLQKRCFAFVVAMLLFLFLLWPATEWLINYFDLK